MNSHKGLVLDANILLRAVFGQAVREILERYECGAKFYSPDCCFRDAMKIYPRHFFAEKPRRGYCALGARSDRPHGGICGRESLPGVRRSCAAACRTARSGRLADCRRSSIARSADLDRRPGLLRQRHPYVDDRPRRTFPPRQSGGVSGVRCPCLARSHSSVTKSLGASLPKRVKSAKRTRDNCVCCRIRASSCGTDVPPLINRSSG